MPRDEQPADDEIFRAILDAASAAVFVKDSAGRYRFVNRRWEERFGRRREEVLGRSDDEVFSPEAAARARAEDAAVLGGAPVEREEADVSGAVLTRKFAVGQAVCGISTDVAEALFSQLSGNIPDHAFVLLDDAGRVLTWSAEAERIAGQSAAQILGREFCSQETLRRATAEGSVEEHGGRLLARPRGFLLILQQAVPPHYRALVENALDIVAVLDAEFRIVYANPAAERVLGYPPPEYLGRSALEFVHPEDALSVGRELALGAAQPGNIGQVEFRFRHKDGSWRYLEGVGRNVLDNPAVRGLVINCRDVTERREAETALREREARLRQGREELRALAVRLMRAGEEERKRVSRELHDDLNQRLAMLEVELDALARDLPDPVAGQLRALGARLAALTEDVRRMAHRLHPAILDDLGLVPALRAYCGDFSRRHGIEVSFTHQEVSGAFSPEVALCLYRVAQEALWNVARHSGASRARVLLAGAAPGWLRLSIQDFGRGFDVAAVKGRGSLGLLSIEERVRLAHGKMSVVSQPGHGAEIVVEIPLAAP